MCAPPNLSFVLQNTTQKAVGINLQTTFLFTMSPVNLRPWAKVTGHDKI